MKKKILALVLVVVLLLTAITGTLAYFTDTDSADNTFTVGNVDIELKENNATPEEWQDWVDYVHPDIVPGEEIDKAVTVENVDNEDAWVRVTVVVPTDMTATVNTDLGGWTMSKPYGENSNIFVFTGKLAAGATSPVLLQKVKINEDVTNQGKISEYHIPVLAEAIQVTGFEDDMSGAFATLATSNVKNYIDQYVANDAFKALKSGDIVTVAANTKLPQNLNTGVVVMGDVTASAPTEVELPTHPETGNHTIITSGTTFANLHFTERLLVIGDATFVNCTFDYGLWMTGITGNVSLVNCTIEGADSGVDLLLDGAADANGKNHGRVIVKDCTINGSSSIQGATSALYENCTFGATGWSWKQIRINCPTTIENCGAAETLSYANGGNHTLRIVP